MQTFYIDIDDDMPSAPIPFDVVVVDKYAAIVEAYKILSALEVIKASSSLSHHALKGIIRATEVNRPPVDGYLQKGGSIQRDNPYIVRIDGRIMGEIKMVKSAKDMVFTLQLIENTPYDLSSLVGITAEGLPGDAIAEILRAVRKRLELISVETLGNA